MLPAHPEVAIVGALTYTAITKTGCTTGRELISAHHCVNGRRFHLEKSIFFFHVKQGKLIIIIIIMVLSCSLDY